MIACVCVHVFMSQLPCPVAVLQELGLFSTHAVERSKDLFWQRFSQGKVGFRVHSGIAATVRL